ncbi:MAG: hypothetical protein ABR553_09500 [Gammaproteobacteria bacterium]
MRARPELRGLQHQTGAVGLLAALFLITAVLVMGQALLRQSASGANDSLIIQDGVDALFLAESGLERAAAQLSEGSAGCDATLAGSWAYAGGTVALADLGAGFTSDFDGSALPAGRCRVRATGTSGLYGAQRTLDAIIGTDAGNLLDPNANFDTPAGTCPPNCAPANWTIDSGGWTSNGGVGGSPAVQVAKTGAGGPQNIDVVHAAFTPFTVTAPTTLTIGYDYRVLSPSDQDVQLTMRLLSTSGPYTATVTYSTTTGTFLPETLAISVTGSGSVTIDGFSLTLHASGGQAKSLWVDNLELAGGGGGAGVERWREIIN